MSSDPRSWRRFALAILAMGAFHGANHAVAPHGLPPLLAWLWIGLTVALWVGGFRHLGHPLQRLVILAALALPFPALTLETRSMAQGWHDVRSEATNLPAPPPGSLEPETGFHFRLQQLLVWLTLTGFFHLIARHQSHAAREAQRADALKDQALRAKLAPHFIFNTLNTLKAQIEQDPHAASATTDRLASLFRQVVQVADQPTIPLKQELAFVEAYLGIEQARLGDRLTVVMDIPEDLDDRPVPPLSLQVLVENAIKHGIAPFEHPGTVTIQAEAVPEGLRLSVRDTGLGSATQPGTGTALATLRQRLARPEDVGWERLPSGFKASFLWRQP